MREFACKGRWDIIISQFADIKLLLIGQGFDGGEGVEARCGEDAAAAVEEEGEGAADAAEAVVERRGHARPVVLLVKGRRVQLN